MYAIRSYYGLPVVFAPGRGGDGRHARSALCWPPEPLALTVLAALGTGGLCARCGGHQRLIALGTLLVLLLVLLATLGPLLVLLLLLAALGALLVLLLMLLAALGTLLVLLLMLLAALGALLVRNNFV